MRIKAEFELEADEKTVKTIYESVKAEHEERSDKRHSVVDLILDGNTLQVSMHGEDTVRLRAVANTWLRLLKIAHEMVQVVNECGTSGF